uniref:EGF-like domain-containing protein n=1 Tax=Chromera velia CCMP2878 TaxID=1169474 RepID=A0A0G4I061_9ALVE|eukprot:Cvel_9854.t1-p1 / transcript=Cvel_9854.t1 / gene=Cvel_9854 / organism=Chromera_velia_CCMP2878 / gene_product=Fibrillin-1, putative / transcript_product=Fibrillin-1, putative / location=Cvel_scaffold580:28746-51037(+) / protein_length=4013 / sequence_SO=supercontig / SO=protein_coding / is_pseudo=false
MRIFHSIAPLLALFWAPGGVMGWEPFKKGGTLPTRPQMPKLRAAKAIENARSKGKLKERRLSEEEEDARRKVNQTVLEPFVAFQVEDEEEEDGALVSILFDADDIMRTFDADAVQNVMGISCNPEIRVAETPPIPSGPNRSLTIGRSSDKREQFAVVIEQPEELDDFADIFGNPGGGDPPQAGALGERRFLLLGDGEWRSGCIVEKAPLPQQAGGEAGDAAASLMMVKFAVEVDTILSVEFEEREVDGGLKNIGYFVFEGFVTHQLRAHRNLDFSFTVRRNVTVPVHSKEIPNRRRRLACSSGFDFVKDYLDGELTCEKRIDRAYVWKWNTWDEYSRITRYSMYGDSIACDPCYIVVTVDMNFKMEIKNYWIASINLSVGAEASIYFKDSQTGNKAWPSARFPDSFQMGVDFRVTKEYGIKFVNENWFDLTWHPISETPYERIDWISETGRGDQKTFAEHFSTALNFDLDDGDTIVLEFLPYVKLTLSVLSGLTDLQLQVGLPLTGEATIDEPYKYPDLYKGLPSGLSPSAMVDETVCMFIDHYYGSWTDLGDLYALISVFGVRHETIRTEQSFKVTEPDGSTRYGASWSYPFCVDLIQVPESVFSEGRIDIQLVDYDQYGWDDHVKLIKIEGSEVPCCGVVKEMVKENIRFKICRGASCKGVGAARREPFCIEFHEFSWGSGKYYSHLYGWMRTGYQNTRWRSSDGKIWTPGGWSVSVDHGGGWTSDTWQKTSGSGSATWSESSGACSELYTWDDWGFYHLKYGGLKLMVWDDDWDPDTLVATFDVDWEDFQPTGGSQRSMTISSSSAGGSTLKINYCRGQGCDSSGHGRRRLDAEHLENPTEAPSNTQPDTAAPPPEPLSSVLPDEKADNDKSAPVSPPSPEPPSVTVQQPVSGFDAALLPVGTALPEEEQLREEAKSKRGSRELAVSHIDDVHSSGAVSLSHERRNQAVSGVITVCAAVPFHIGLAFEVKIIWGGITAVGMEVVSEVELSKWRTKAIKLFATSETVCIPMSRRTIKHLEAGLGKRFLDECKDIEDNCSEDAVCLDEADGFSCLCRDGFSGDGITCSNVNECDSGAHNCHANARCVDTHGSFLCTCRRELGAFGDNGVTCGSWEGHLQPYVLDYLGDMHTVWEEKHNQVDESHPWGPTVKKHLGKLVDYLDDLITRIGDDTLPLEVKYPSSSTFDIGLLHKTWEVLQRKDYSNTGGSHWFSDNEHDRANVRLESVSQASGPDKQICFIYAEDTGSLADWLSNANAIPTFIKKLHSEESIGLGHAGFVNQANHMRQSIWSKMQFLCSNADSYVFSGYSRGGGIMQAFAAIVAESGEIPLSKMELITYGFPRCLGDRTASQTFVQQLKHSRVIFIDDVVPRVPDEDMISGITQSWNLLEPDQQGFLQAVLDAFGYTHFGDVLCLFCQYALPNSVSSLNVPSGFVLEEQFFRAIGGLLHLEYKRAFEVNECAVADWGLESCRSIGKGLRCVDTPGSFECECPHLFPKADQCYTYEDQQNTDGTRASLDDKLEEAFSQGQGDGRKNDNWISADTADYFDFSIRANERFTVKIDDHNFRPFFVIQWPGFFNHNNFIEDKIDFKKAQTLQPINPSGADGRVLIAVGEDFPSIRSYSSSTTRIDHANHGLNAHMAYSLTISLQPDNNECDDGTHTCSNSQDCVDTPGSFQCESRCPVGKLRNMQAAGYPCENKNECADGEDNCDQNAACDGTYPPGSFSCTCNEGFEGVGTENNCKRLSRCDWNWKLWDSLSSESVRVLTVNGAPLAGHTSTTANVASLTFQPKLCDQSKSPIDSQADVFRFAGTGQPVCVTVCSPLTTFDTRLEVYQACEDVEAVDGDVQCVASNDEAGTTQCRSGHSRLEVATDANKDYFVILHGEGGTPPHGNFVIAASNGPNCDLNECHGNLDPCQDHAACNNNEGSFFCSCNAGYQESSGTSSECIDVDECSDSLHSCSIADHFVCENSVGSFMCKCDDGYVASGSPTECLDVDECTQNNGGCDQNCKDEEGSFSCSCNEGYVLDTNGRSCQDIDECDENIDNCSQYAQCDGDQPAGSFTCTCNNGYVSIGDAGGVSCMDATCEWNFKDWLDPTEVLTVNGPVVRGNTDSPAPLTTSLSRRPSACSTGGGSTSGTVNSRSRLYQFEGTGSSLCLSLCSPLTDFDTMVDVYTDCSQAHAADGELECVKRDDDMSSPSCSSNSRASAVKLSSTQSGKTYYALVSGYHGSSSTPSTQSGDFAISLTSGTSCGVNECQASPKPCDDAALCSDSSGSFTCTCRDDYSGSGTSCDFDHTSCQDSTTSIYACKEGPGYCKYYQINWSTSVTIPIDASSPYWFRVEVTSQNGPYHKFSVHYGSQQLSAGDPGDHVLCFAKSYTLENENNQDRSVRVDCENNWNWHCHLYVKVFGYSKKANGQSCSHDRECLSYYCDSGLCKQTYDCLTTNPSIAASSPLMILSGPTSASVGTTGTFSYTCAAGYHLETSSNSLTASCTKGGWKVSSGTLPKCTDIDECQTRSHQCDDHARCWDSYGSYYCYCNSGWTGSGTDCTGFTGSGVSCADIDECTSVTDPHNCDTHADCIDSQGSFTCHCNVGWTGSGETSSCVDVDECSLGLANCHRNATCSNQNGSFLCTCNNGYVGSNGGVQCSDINECAESSHDCDANAQCINTDGRFHCECLRGYSRTGQQCTDIHVCTDPSHRHNCHSNATCLESEGSFDSQCNLGYNGTGVSCADIDECTSTSHPHNCDVHAECLDSPGSFACRCLDGFIGNGLVGQCVDLNECAGEGRNHTCHSEATCNNTVGSFTCECSTGFFGFGQSCTDIDECTAASNMSVSTNCHTNASCLNTEGSFECVCNNGFNGNGLSCTDIDECSLTIPLHNCHSNATCSDSPGSFTCACMRGYVGNGIDTCNDVKECVIGSHNCHSNATCVETEGSFDCQCNSGFDGTGVTCADIDECVSVSHPHNCDVHAVCTDSEGSFTCSCEKGWTGSGLMGECTDINECSTGADDCHVEAACQNTAGSFTCTCNNGFESATGLGVQCSDIDECTENSHDCDANAYCVNTDGHYHCVCKDGFAGNGRNGKCADIDECTYSNHTPSCHTSGASCANTVGSFICSCNSGWTGTGASCSDIDECTSTATPHDCDANAYCVNSAGAFSCKCNEGFIGDGRIGNCTDLNECNGEGSGHTCHANAACANNAGSFTCACNAGFHGDGHSCADDDECSNTTATHDCHPHALCRNSEGSFSCECGTGYEDVSVGGDGTSCSAILCGADKKVVSHSCLACPAGMVNAPGDDASGGDTLCDDIDECIDSLHPHNCDVNAACINSATSFSCQCNSGFTGDGISCTAVPTSTTTSTTTTTTTTTSTTTTTPAPTGPPVVRGLALGGREGGTGWTIALTESGPPVVWGRNREGQLGVGDTVNRRNATRVVGIPGKVVKACGGYDHSLFLTETGLLYGAGLNGHGQLGQGSVDSDEHSTPILVPTGSVVGNILGIACGPRMNALWTDRDETYTWGSGHLALNLTTDVLTPTFVPALSGIPVRKVVMGGVQAFALTTDDRLFAWGWGGQGALATGSQADEKIPVEVAGLGAVADVAAEWLHSLVLTRTGDVLTCGRNHNGQIGRGQVNRWDSGAANHPEVVASGVAGIAAGQTTSFYWKSDGKAFCTGNGWAGQLGFPAGTGKDHFTEVTTGVVWMGSSGGAVHTGAIKNETSTSVAKLFMTGANYNGQLGLGVIGDTVEAFTEVTGLIISRHFGREPQMTPITTTSTSTTTTTISTTTSVVPSGTCSVALTQAGCYQVTVRAPFANGRVSLCGGGGGGCAQNWTPGGGGGGSGACVADLPLSRVLPDSGLSTSTELVFQACVGAGGCGPSPADSAANASDGHPSTFGNWTAVGGGGGIFGGHGGRGGGQPPHAHSLDCAPLGPFLWSGAEGGMRPLGRGGSCGMFSGGNTGCAEGTSGGASLFAHGGAMGYNSGGENGQLGSGGGSACGGEGGDGGQGFVNLTWACDPSDVSLQHFAVLSS